MSKKANLKRARIVELKHKSGGWPAVAINVSGGLWEVSGYDYVPTADELLSRFDVVGVLAEFPVTLADLLPKGCTEFRFTDTYGALRVAWRDGNRWRTSDNDFDDLHELQDLMDIDLDSVVPLQVHLQYVEERR